MTRSSSMWSYAPEVASASFGPHAPAIENPAKKDTCGSSSLTNYDLPTVRERCMAAGADHFLDKMREIDQLMPILLQIAGRKP
jgi:CheY-like chemotaxis protein